MKQDILWNGKRNRGMQSQEKYSLLKSWPSSAHQYNDEYRIRQWRTRPFTVQVPVVRFWGSMQPLVGFDVALALLLFSIKWSGRPLFCICAASLCFRGTARMQRITGDRLFAKPTALA